MEIIKDNPIGNGLDSFYASFNIVYIDKGIPYILDAPSQFDLKGRISITSILYILLTSI